jgi:hypothetical protein
VQQHTNEISSGSYGPFSIGEGKLTALGKIEKITSIRSIEPIPQNEIYLENPDLTSIHAVDVNDGVLVWLGHHPWPLRIELRDNVVVNKWGMSDQCRASQPQINLACSEVKRLASKVDIGATRTDFYKIIISFDTKLSKQVGNFVVGLQNFRIGKDNSEQAYRELILSNDAWQFEGLKELSKYKNPFYSQVTLYFHEGRLIKVKHWSSPYEML